VDQPAGLPADPGRAAVDHPDLREQDQDERELDALST
jgi:hypothetical protein